MTYQDCLLLLLCLPRTRLCQMLCIWSGEAQIEKVWGLLLWLETLRADAPSQLSRYTRTRLNLGLLPEDALNRLCKPDEPYSLTVLELVTHSLFTPLLAARCQTPDVDELCAVRDSWEVGDQHTIVASSALLDLLPVKARNQLTATGPLDCVLLSQERPLLWQEHQATPLLLHVLLFLLHRGYLSGSMLANLFVAEVHFPKRKWESVAEGLQKFATQATSPTWTIF